jgi:hypothetical protein
MIGIMILQACASLPDDQGNQFKVKSGTTVLDIENKFGESSCHFSYFMDGKKYDFVEFAQSPSLAVFEDNRLYTVILRGQRSNLDKLFIESMGKDDLPLEKGLCPIHSWVREYRDMTGIRLDLEEGDDLLAEAQKEPVLFAALIVVGTATLPIWGSFVIVGEMARALSKKEYRMSRSVNESLIRSDSSYSDFTSWLSQPDISLKNELYSVRLYTVAKSFFTPHDFIYTVGFVDGKVVWVAYNSWTIQHDLISYMQSHPSP